MTTDTNPEDTTWSFASAFGWVVDLLATVVTISALLALGFTPTAPNGALAIAIFAVIISATAVFFTSFISNANLVLAIRRSGDFPMMIGFFAIPVLSSLVGLAISVSISFFNSPMWINQVTPQIVPQIILLFFLFYAIYGFIGTVLYVLILMSLTSIADAKQRQS